MSGEDPDSVDSVRHAMTLFLEALKQMFRARSASNEKLSLSLRVYDSTDQHLSMFEQVRTWDADPTWARVPLGAGVAGAAFKQRRAMGHTAPSLLTTGAGDSYLYTDPEAEANEPVYQVLMSVPFFHPTAATIGHPGPRQAVGVMSLGSDSPGSGLIELLDPAVEDRQDHVAELRAMGQALFEMAMNAIVPDSIDQGSREP